MITDFFLKLMSNVLGNVMGLFLPRVPGLDSAGADVGAVMVWFSPFLQQANYFFPVTGCLLYVTIIIAARMALLVWMAFWWGWEHTPLIGKG